MAGNGLLSPKMRASRCPFELVLLTMCTLGGIVGLLSGPTGAVRLLPSWFVTPWYIGLLAGGVIGMAAFAIPGAVGLLVERAVLIELAMACLSYAALLIGYGGARDAPTLAILAVFVLACVVRIRAIGADITATHRVMAALAPEHKDDT